MEDEMSKLPWFPFYASDFLTSTGSMSNEEVGAYIKLLCYQWDKGVLPSDLSRLARMAGYADANAFASLWDIIRDKFSQTKDGYINPKMAEHRKRQEELCEKNSTKAKNRWGTNAVAMPQHMQVDMPNGCNQESESNPNPESNLNPDPDPSSTSNPNPNPDSPVEEVDEFVSDSNTQTSELATKLWEALGSPKAHNPSKWAGTLSTISPDWTSEIENLIHYVSISPRWKKYVSQAKFPAAYFVSQIESIEEERVRYEAKRDAARKPPPKPAPDPQDDVPRVTEEQVRAFQDDIRGMRSKQDLDKVNSITVIDELE
jgi:uncharacterized protein YdaU (DUF1376 family)